MIRVILTKLLWAVMIFVAFDVAVVIALPYLVPKEKIKSMISEGSNGSITYSDASMVFWPNVGVALKDVVISDQVTKQKQISVGKLDVAVAVLPLLDHHVVIKQFTLDEPVLYGTLTATGDGMDFSNLSTAIPQQQSPQQPALRKTLDKPVMTSGSGFDIDFEKIKISNGKLVALSQQDKAFIDGINVDVKKNTGGMPMQVDGGFSYKGRKVGLSLGLEKPDDFLAGKPSPGQVSFKTDDFSVKADGVLAMKGTFLKGALELEAPSITKALAWVPELTVKKAPFEKLSFTSTASVTSADVILKDAALKLDDVEAKGNVNVTLGGRPDIFARLSLNKLNLDRFTGAAGDKSSAADEAGNGGKRAAETSSGGWSDAPLDFSGLRAVNADLKLDTQGFSLRGADVGPSTLTVQLQNGDLRFKSSEATLFGGRFSSDLSLNAANTMPSMGFNFAMAGVQAKPVLETFAHFKKLSGAADAHVSLTATGASQRAIIASLGGKGDLDFKNGALEGIDLARIAKLIQSHLTDMAVGDGKTEFVDMGGTFTMTRGVATNADLKMTGPLVKATGKGTLDLPRQFIQYRATPMLTTAAEEKGLAVPVNIAGPFSNIKVVPDFASAVQDLAAHPENMKATVKDIKESIKTLKKDPLGALQNILGRKPPDAAPAATPDATAPAGVLETAPAPLVPEQSPQPATP